MVKSRHLLKVAILFITCGLTWAWQENAEIEETGFFSTLYDETIGLALWAHNKVKKAAECRKYDPDCDVEAMLWCKTPPERREFEYCRYELFQPLWTPWRKYLYKTDRFKPIDHEKDFP